MAKIHLQDKNPVFFLWNSPENYVSFDCMTLYWREFYEFFVVVIIGKENLNQALILNINNIHIHILGM